MFKARFSESINFVNTLEIINSCFQVQEFERKDPLIETTQNELLKGNFYMIMVTRTLTDFYV